MNNGIWALIRLVARSVGPTVDVSVILVSSPFERNELGSIYAGGRTRSTGPGNSSGEIERRAWSRMEFGHRLPKAIGTPGRGTHGQANYTSYLALRPVEVPRTLRDDSGGSPEFP